eukprot:TRINITY_DN670_c0_g1_i13.p2 TRINITY_DN670_c0_g1~~TRINITY_DN670_c0_g1_i13.p2  ORF type:complete len:155 (-),score=5.80 TRINITY_DN670_c0_g1_i13:47-511(-)
MFTSAGLCICVVILMTTMASYNVVGLAITKYASATARAILDVARTVIIWIIFLCLGWEKFLSWQVPIKLVGFIFLSFGTLLYNEIIVLKFWGFEKNTNVYLAKLGGAEDDETAALARRDSQYVGASPHALYDENRQALPTHFQECQKSSRTANC